MPVAANITVAAAMSGTATRIKGSDTTAQKPRYAGPRGAAAPRSGIRLASRQPDPVKGPGSPQGLANGGGHKFVKFITFPPYYRVGEAVQVFPPMRVYPPIVQR